MIFLLIGIVFTAVFFLLSILIVGYAVFLWESNKVDSLASKIRHQQDSNILSKSSVNREFTTFDLNKSLAKTKSKAGQVYSNTLMAIKEHNYPSWFRKLKTILKDLRHNTWETIKRFASYLHNLTKPLEKEKEEQQEQKIRERHQEVIDETVEKVIGVKSSAPITDYTEAGYAEAKPLENIEEIENKQENQNMASNSSDKATLDFASNDSDTTGKSMTLFEKLEARVLTKLKEGGMDNYDIWLELGDLYLKFDEKQKAREVYALVLKHSEGKSKELARNRLIGLS